MSIVALWATCFFNSFCAICFIALLCLALSVIVSNVYSVMSWFFCLVFFSLSCCAWLRFNDNTHYEINDVTGVTYKVIGNFSIFIGATDFY